MLRTHLVYPVALPVSLSAAARTMNPCMDGIRCGPAFSRTGEKQNRSGAIVSALRECPGWRLLEESRPRSRAGTAVRLLDRPAPVRDAIYSAKMRDATSKELPHDAALCRHRPGHLRGPLPRRCSSRGHHTGMALQNAQICTPRPHSTQSQVDAPIRRIYRARLWTGGSRPRKWWGVSYRLCK